MQNFIAKMTKKQKRMLKRILIGALGFLFYILIYSMDLLSGVPYCQWIYLLILIVIYLVLSYDILLKSITNIRNGQIFDENFLMSIASIGAFILKEYNEAVAVMLFYQVGEWFQSYAVHRSRENIASLMDIRPDHANLLVDGMIEEVDPEQVPIGSVIVVRPGERIPLDGIVVQGQSSIDTSALTGESVPRNVRLEDEVVSGCINLNGQIHVRVTHAFYDSTVNKILDLVENVGNKKSKSEQFITKFARYYTPIVVGLALSLAIIPSLLVGGWGQWLYRALTFLVISCPCALVISVPLSFFGGIGGASRQGILIKGSNYMETLANMDTIVFDKTGTLTQGEFKVVNVSSQDPDFFLEMCAHAESLSLHPIALSIQKAYGKNVDSTSISNAQEIAGHGVICEWNGHTIVVGNEKMMKLKGISYSSVPSFTKTVVHGACDDRYIGYLEIADAIKTTSKEAINQLKLNGVSRVIMLSGDSQAVADEVANELNIDEVHASLLPQDKVMYFEKIQEQNSEKKVGFVGDGINDAPVLTRADVGIAMGGLGSDAAIEAADIVLMDDDPLRIAKAIKVARKTIKIVRQNIVFAIGVKVFVLLLGALGIANMWAAVFADVGVAFLAILNAMRCMSTNNL